MAQSSFTCPHGHTWSAPSSGVSLIGGKFVACPVCAALVRVEGGHSTVEGTEPASLLQPTVAPEPEPPEFGGTLLQSQLETWRKMPKVEVTAIGDYDVMSELGRGGMGVVYRAKHRKLKRVVALKMVLAGEFASSESLRRFQAEAEAVARLQHPGIVQIYDVGEQDKKPYFAMEFCDGGSLHDRLDVPMPPRVAAQVMVQVARAMHAAHQAGIVHRDLKPANILLTKDNQPKITDFGLAKRLDEVQGKTKTGDVLGTPSYMAPEQAEGKLKDIGPCTDVYALGAILYEMLTARQAFQAETAMDTLFQVLYEEPVAPARLVPKLPKDMETICLKCLSKDIAKRYMTAEELAQDLERFLEDKPIIARPSGVLEKAFKWAKRHPAAAGLIGVSGLALVGVLGLSLYFNIHLNTLNANLVVAEKDARDNEKIAKDNEKLAKEEAKRADDNAAKAKAAEKVAIVQRKLAEANFAKARAAVQSMLTQVGQSELAYVPLMEEIRRKLLTEALQFNKEFLAQKGGEADVRRQAALSHQHLADIHKMLGDYPEADQENQEAIRQLQKLAEEFPTQADYRRDLAASHFHRGQLLRDQGRYVDAEAAYRESLRLREQLAEQAPDQAELRRELARTCTDLGQIARLTNRPDQSAEFYQRALGLHEKLVQEEPDQPDYRDGLGGTLNDLGNLLRGTRKPKELKEAEKVYRQALTHFQDMVKRWPNQSEFRRKQAATLNNLGNVFLDMKDYPEAVSILKQSLAERQKLVDQFPSTLAYRLDLASTHNNLAAALASAGNLPEAEQQYAEALKIHRKLVADLPGSPDFQSQLGAVLDNLGALMGRQGQSGQARKLLDEALTYHELARKTNPSQPLYRLFLRNHFSVLAETLARQAEKGEGNSQRDVAAAVAEMLKLKADSADDFYRAATLLSRCVPLALKDAGLADDQRKALADKYAADAVGYLREAVKRGLADPESIKTAATFNPLRNRDDFKKLVAELK